MQKKAMIQPIIKFNGGIGALLCNKCSKIIKTNLTKEDLLGSFLLLFCEKCDKEVYGLEKEK